VQGPGNLWLFCSVPATGSRLLIDTTGTPTQGAPRNVGATQGAMAVSMGAKYAEIPSDQTSSPIDAVMDSDAYELDVTLEEMTFLNLRDALGIGTYATGTDAGLPVGAQNYEELAFGGIIAVPKVSVATIAQRREVAGKFAVFQLYNAYSAEAVKLDFERAKHVMWKVKFKGLATASRPLGDQVGKFFRQT